MLGGVVSCTVTPDEHEPVLPDGSVAEQVSIVEPSANVDPDGGAHVTGRLAAQLSVADAVKLAGAPAGLVHSSVALAGHVTVGRWRSRTVTTALQLAVAPAAS